MTQVSNHLCFGWLVQIVIPSFVRLYVDNLHKMTTVTLISVTIPDVTVTVTILIMTTVTIDTMTKTTLTMTVVAVTVVTMSIVTVWTGPFLGNDSGK